MLLLTAPAQHIARNPAVECDPKRVRHWLDELSAGDAQSTVAQLITALRPFNELQLDVKARLKLLEIYCAAFENILGMFDDIHLRGLALDHAQRQQLADDIMWVYLELANGYKSIIKSVYEGSSEAPAQEDLLLSIYRGIELIANALLYAYRNHRTPPPLVYLEIHQLYFLAEQYGLQTQTIGCLKQHARNPSIANLYMHIMLLVAGNTYGYDGSQINELYELLGQYAKDCRLSAEVTEADQRSGYFIDFTEDQGPRRYRNKGADELLGMQRILSISKAVQHILADLSQGQQEPVYTIRGTELRLLRLFIQNLHQGAQHEQPRATGEHARIAYGMEAVAYYLENRERLLETHTDTVTGIEVRELDEFEAEHELLEWEVANVTQQGRLLIADQAQNSYLRVGEVLSVVEHVGSSREALINHGLIRALQHVDDRIHIGVEFLGGTPGSISCQALGEQGLEPAEFKALYFPSNKADREPASLLFDYEQFRTAGRFRVNVGGQHYTIEPVKIIKESPVHIQFGFRVVR